MSERVNNQEEEEEKEFLPAEEEEEHRPVTPNVVDKSADHRPATETATTGALEHRPATASILHKPPDHTERVLMSLDPDLIQKDLVQVQYPVDSQMSTELINTYQEDNKEPLNLEMWDRDESHEVATATIDKVDPMNDDCVSDIVDDFIFAEESRMEEEGATLDEFPDFESAISADIQEHDVGGEEEFVVYDRNLALLPGMATFSAINAGHL
jgi:hypothetical protein